MQLLATCIINKTEAQGIICEQRGWPVNWAMFGEWTIKDQLRRTTISKGRQVDQKVEDFIQAKGVFQTEGLEEEKTKFSKDTMAMPVYVASQVPKNKGGMWVLHC